MMLKQSTMKMDIELTRVAGIHDFDPDRNSDQKQCYDDLSENLE